MITKITMASVASYKQPTSLETDKKVNLIYGLNGTGKSTLSNYLYQPQSEEYATCSKSGSSDAELLVYNSRFVRENFYELDHQNGIFTVSKENSEAEKKLNQTQAELADLNKEIEQARSEIGLAEALIQSSRKAAEETAWEIKTTYSGGDRVLEFCLEGLMGKKSKLLDYLLTIPRPATKPTRDIDHIRREVESISGDDAQHFSTLSMLHFDGSATESDPIFRQIIVGNENSSVSALIKKLDSSDWVKEGINYLDILSTSEDETCPFCQERTISKTISNAIREYFDESYEESINALNARLSNYQSALDSLEALDIYGASPFLKESLKELSGKYDALVELIQRNQARIKAKIKNPSQEQALESSSSLLGEINAIVEAANVLILENNRKLENKQQEMKRLYNEFWGLMRWNYDPLISLHLNALEGANNKLGELLLDITPLETSKANLASEISEIQKQTVNVDAAIECINTRLTDLGIDSFQIVKHEENLYRIVRGEADGDFITLSEGEKTVISFLYFVECCKGRKNAADVTGERIVIIDDPISSLSHIYVFNIGELIKREFSNSDSFAQVFILTHSLYFFYELADMKKERRDKQQKLFRLTKSPAGSQIIEMKYDEVQNDYQAYWSIIKDTNQPPALIANCMRNIVEYFLGSLKDETSIMSFKRKSFMTINIKLLVDL